MCGQSLAPGAIEEQATPLASSPSSQGSREHLGNAFPMSASAGCSSGDDTEQSERHPQIGDVCLHIANGEPVQGRRGPVRKEGFHGGRMLRRPGFPWLPYREGHGVWSEQKGPRPELGGRWGVAWLVPGKGLRWLGGWGPWEAPGVAGWGPPGRRAGWGVWGQARPPLSQHGSTECVLRAPSPPPEPF